MRLRISLFDLLLIVTPAIAIALGLLVAAINAPDPTSLLTLAQGISLLSMLAAVCACFHRRGEIRAFAGAFLAASLGHLLLTVLTASSPYDNRFPTNAGFALLWDSLRSVQDSEPPTVSSAPVGWSSYPPSLLISGSGDTFTTIGAILDEPHKLAFVAIGRWTTSLLLGLMCGLVAKSLRSEEKTTVVRLPATATP